MAHFKVTILTMFAIDSGYLHVVPRHKLLEGSLVIGLRFLSLPKVGGATLLLHGVPLDTTCRFHNRMGRIRLLIVSTVVPKGVSSIGGACFDHTIANRAEHGTFLSRRECCGNQRRFRICAVMTGVMAVTLGAFVASGMACTIPIFATVAIRMEISRTTCKMGTETIGTFGGSVVCANLRHIRGHLSKTTAIIDGTRLSAKVLSAVQVFRFMAFCRSTAHLSNSTIFRTVLHATMAIDACSFRYNTTLQCITAIRSIIVPSQGRIAGHTRSYDTDRRHSSSIRTVFPGIVGTVGGNLCGGLTKLSYTSAFRCIARSDLRFIGYYIAGNSAALSHDPAFGYDATACRFLCVESITGYSQVRNHTFCNTRISGILRNLRRTTNRYSNFNSTGSNNCIARLIAQGNTFAFTKSHFTTRYCYMGRSLCGHTQILTVSTCMFTDRQAARTGHTLLSTNNVAAILRKIHLTLCRFRSTRDCARSTRCHLHLAIFQTAGIHKLVAARNLTICAEGRFGAIR